MCVLTHVSFFFYFFLLRGRGGGSVGGVVMIMLEMRMRLTSRGSYVRRGSIDACQEWTQQESLLSSQG